MAALTRGINPNLCDLDTVSGVCAPGLTLGLTPMGPPMAHPDGNERASKLRRTIESQIIPRLMLTARMSAPTAGSTRSVARFHAEVSAPSLSRNSVIQFSNVLLEGDVEVALRIVDELESDGVRRSSILLDLFAPAARLLGEMWEIDACTFADVTIAMGALQQAMRRLEPVDHLEGAGMRRRILLGPVAGEQHTFPIQMLDAFFQSAGWMVATETSFDLARIGVLLRKRRFDAIGLSISRDSLLDQLACDIQVLRRITRNQPLVILVGGRVISARPELVSSLGADAMADDARSAIRVAEQFVGAAGDARA